jgi:hypothetical protein
MEMELDTHVCDWFGGSNAQCDGLLAGPAGGEKEQWGLWKIEVLGRVRYNVRGFCTKEG